MIISAQSAVAVVGPGQTNFPPSDQIRKQINLKPNLKDVEDTKTAEGMLEIET